MQTHRCRQSDQPIVVTAHSLLPPKKKEILTRRYRDPHWEPLDLEPMTPVPDDLGMFISIALAAVARNIQEQADAGDRGHQA